jgi:tRNA G37 N-methylase Trm5
LLPSSEAAWEASLLTLKPTGGTLHIHMNVEEENIDDWVKDTVVRFEQMSHHHQRGFKAEVLHLERVKWFAPRVRHVVLDLSLRP